MPSGLDWFSTLFIGSTPSIVAAVAIFTTIALFVVALFVSGGSATVGQKVGSSVLLFLVLLPSIGLSLFDINCLMWSGDENLCAILAWVKALIILLYTGMIAALTISILYYGKALKYDGFEDAKKGDELEGIFSMTSDSPSDIETFVDGSGNVIKTVTKRASAPIGATAKKPALKKPAVGAAPAAPAAEPVVNNFVGSVASVTAAASADPVAAAMKGLGDFLTEEKKTEQFFGGSMAPIAHMSPLTAGLAPAS